MPPNRPGLKIEIDILKFLDLNIEMLCSIHVESAFTKTLHGYHKINNIKNTAISFRIVERLCF